jgi:hypothetical protein
MLKDNTLSHWSQRFVAFDHVLRRSASLSLSQISVSLTSSQHNVPSVFASKRRVNRLPSFDVVVLAALYSPSELHETNDSEKQDLTLDTTNNRQRWLLDEKPIAKPMN